MIVKYFFYSFLILSFLLAATAAAQQSELGTVDFPTSGSPKAQTHFLRGLAALHSFWYPQALDEFREATRIEPDFMMGYWGEAMAHNRTIWFNQDTEAARKVLLNIKKTEKLTDREKAYLDAVRVLYGQGDKDTRDISYLQLMEKIYRDYPSDLEAAAFYSLSLLGTVQPREKGFARRMKAGSIALDVYQKNPNHPGAAHYIIHAFDDPEHAILALPAAYRYAQIAPASSHAVHMPSHIFLQLGMWENVVSSNESAWNVSVSWVKNNTLSPRLRDYHSLYWLLYGYVQRGQYKKAEAAIYLIKETMESAVNGNTEDSDYYEFHYTVMVANYVINSERWNKAKKLLDVIPQGGQMKATNKSPQLNEQAAHHEMKMSPNSKTVDPADVDDEEFTTIFVRGLAAANMNNLQEAEKKAEEVRKMRDPDDDLLSIMELEIRAASASTTGNHKKAITMMKQATAIEEKMSSPYGPPLLIKPSHELFGEILLKANRFKEASQAFAISLSRQPNRMRSLLGAARAANKLGDKTQARENYSMFLSIQSQADLDSDVIREARDYLKQM